MPTGEFYIHCHNCVHWQGECEYGWHPGDRRHLEPGVENWLDLYELQSPRPDDMLHVFAKECKYFTGECGKPAALRQKRGVRLSVSSTNAG